MKTTKYLYDIEPQTFIHIQYHKALEFKIKKAKELLHKLLEPEINDRDENRIDAVYNAIEFNKKLLNEIKGDI